MHRVRPVHPRGRRDQAQQGVSSRARPPACLPAPAVRRGRQAAVRGAPAAGVTQQHCCRGTLVVEFSCCCACPDWGSPDGAPHAGYHHAMEKHCHHPMTAPHHASSARVHATVQQLQSVHGMVSKQTTHASGA